LSKEQKGADRGVVTFETSVVNQNDQLVLVYTDKVLLKGRAG
jgi:acyl dehydratase